MTDKANCEICLGDLENPVNYCRDSSHPPFCRVCAVSFIENRIKDSFLGSCPVIYCPASCHQGKTPDGKAKKRLILPSIAWKDHIHPEVLTKYNALASSLLAFLCGGCHTLKSLDVGFEGNRSSAPYTHIAKVLTDQYGDSLGTEKYAELEKAIQDFCVGEYTVEQFYHYLLEEVLIMLKTSSDEPAWETFSKLLKMIPEPERRCNLHLRYLRDRPRMKTLCCNREHCFRCKVKDFHDGKTCMESTATLDQSIVTCPQCNIALARGDGCNTITCVCGKQFSWSQEKENSERCVQFLTAHPKETSIHCAIVLCTRSPSPLFTQAKAWQTRNRMEVNRALTEWFKKKFWPFPSQACTTLIIETQPDGVKEAIELWKNTHAAEVNKRKEENDLALRAIFLDYVPDEKDRPAFAFRIISQSRRVILANVDEKMIQSAMKWVEKNREIYERGIEAMEERSAQQFLYLFGNRLVKETFPAYNSFPSGGEWNRDVSNSELTYTNNNMTVERVGSVSCYPAAFCKLTADKCMFRVVVDAAPRSSNWLTFGVAKKGMANSSSDGVGRTSNTWGISDDRSSSSNYTIVAANGTEVGRFRKLHQGDILTASIDTVDGWVDISVNEEEFLHRFTIPPGTMEDYYFAMSFANDHRVTIISDGITMKKTAPNKEGELNSDHTVMYNNLRKILRAMLADPDDNTTTNNHNNKTMNLSKNSKIMTSGEIWLASCGYSSEVASEMFDMMRPSIENMLSIHKKDPSSSAATAASINSNPFETLSWNTLIEAASWYHNNRETILAQRQYDMAIAFSMMHCEDAAFMAAMNLMEYHTHKVDKDSAASSLAYMKVFSEEVNAWYDYNASLREPVIENIAKNCRCLPRHTKSCPLANKK